MPKKKVIRDSLMPTRKVGSSAIAGSLTILIVWALKDYAHIEFPSEASAAFGVIITALTGYFVPDAE